MIFDPSHTHTHVHVKQCRSRAVSSSNIIERSPETPLAEDGTRGRRPTRPPILLSAYSCNREENSLVSASFAVRSFINNEEKKLGTRPKLCLNSRTLRADLDTFETHYLHWNGIDIWNNLKQIKTHFPSRISFGYIIARLRNTLDDFSLFFFFYVKQRIYIPQVAIRIPYGFCEANCGTACCIPRA